MFKNLMVEDKHVVDLLGVNALWLVFWEHLPQIAVLGTFIWTLIRIFETSTVQSFLNWVFKRGDKDG